MAETRRKFDRDFREDAVRLVRETGKPIAQVARDLGINSGTLGNWVNADRSRQGGGGTVSEDERAELARLRKENAELAMRCDVLMRSVALGWFQRVGQADDLSCLVKAATGVAVDLTDREFTG